MKEVDFKGWNFLEYPGQTTVGLVLVHQIMGLGEYERIVAKDLSDAGYWVFAVDLFRGKHPDSFQAGLEIRDRLKKEECVKQFQLAGTCFVKGLEAEVRSARWDSAWAADSH